MKKRICFIAAIVMLFLMFPAAAFAAEGNSSGVPAKRTILMYVCGSNLESNSAMATYNLRQILNAEFSKDEDVKFIIMTGGANLWHLEDEYLVFPEEGVNLPEDAVVDEDGQQVDPKSRISNCYNQIWEAKGTDAGENPGKLVLVDGDGITADEPVKSEEEVMTDPETLKAFINYGVRKYPAEKYDLILWDHGGGSTGGFGADDHLMFGGTMPFSGIMDAFRDNAVTNMADDDPSNDRKFDFINFDACLMSCIDFQLVMPDYTDYYIASPEIVPGYGQYYTEWLNMLGQDPEKNAFELGKRMVDDFIQFYEEGDGKGEEGTLAVTDCRKFVDSGIADALSDMSGLLEQQAEAGLFYDEVNSSSASIKYSALNFFDLGNFASMVSVVNSEVTEEDLDQEGELKTDNVYADARITERVCSVLQNPEIIYARGTKGIKAESHVYRTSDGGIDIGPQPTSGISFYFLTVNNNLGIDNYFNYYDELSKVVEMMPEKGDNRYRFLKDYKDDLIDYAFITATGDAVNELINSENVDKKEIDYDRVKAYQMGDDEEAAYTVWATQMKPLFQRCSDGESEARKAWLDKVVRQQAEEAIVRQNVTARKVKQKNGTGFQVRISDTRNRIIESVERKISLDVPAINDYMDEHGEGGDPLTFGSVSGYLDLSSALQPDATITDIIRWYNGKESEWMLDAPEEKWYAIKDAEGHLHAVALESEDDNSFIVAAASGEGENEQHFSLKFEKGDNESKLIEITDTTSQENNRPVKPSELVEPVSLMPSMHVTGRSHGAFVNLYIPTSDTMFSLSAESADRISLVYADIKDITDIRDTDNDGTVFHSSFSILDMYGCWTDITDIVNGSEDNVTDIELVRVRPVVYTGENFTPEVIYQGEILQDGTDYTWESIDPEHPGTEFSEVGEYPLLLKGMGRFTGLALKTFYIVMDENAAEALVAQAEDEYAEAKAAMDEAIASGASLQAAYARLINAQNALIEAKDELERIRTILSGEKQAELEERIGTLEDQIEYLTEQLAEAEVVDISNFQVSIKTSFVYTGKAVKPAVKVSGISSAAYKVYYSANTKVGTAKLTIKATDPAYKGSITRTFKIVPKKAVIAKAAASKKQLTVKAKTKVAATGGAQYQIQYRVKGTSKWKSVNTKKQSLTIKKLKKGKKYQVRIRAFRKVGKTTYYGEWSKVKTTKKVK